MFRGTLANEGHPDSQAPQTNQTLWKFNTGGQVGSPIIVDGIAYTGSYDRKVYAFNATNGQLIWNYTTDGIIVSKPSIEGGIICVGSEDFNLYALNASTGEKLWNYKTGYYVDSDPLIVDGVVYFGSEDSKVYALNVTTGKQIWNYTTGDSIMLSSVAVQNGTVYIEGDLE